MGSSEFTCGVSSCPDSFDSKHARGLHMGKGHTDEELREPLLRDLRSVANEMGRTPSVSTHQERGDYGRDMFESVFGSWSASVSAAGLPPARQFEHTEEELCEELRRLADELGRTPRRDEMRERGNMTSMVYTSRFGSWNDALREAGLEPFERVNIPNDELLDELHNLAETLGRSPTQKDVIESGDFHPATYERSFGSWNAALREANLEVHITHDVPRERLLDELRSVAADLGTTPTAKQIAKHGEYSIGPYKRQFGTWNRAVLKAGLEPNIRQGVCDPRYGPGWTRSKRERVLRRDRYRCVGCGIHNAQHKSRYDVSLHVHHLIPAREFPDRDPRANLMRNLVSLCHVCHLEWEHAAGASPPNRELPTYCDPPDPDRLTTLSDFAEV